MGVRVYRLEIIVRALGMFLSIDTDTKEFNVESGFQ